MGISGVVITLAEEHAQAGEALASLRTAKGVTLGEVSRRNPRLWPAVLEAPDAKGDEQLYSWVEGLSGVAWVQLAFASFDEDSSAGEKSR